MLKFIFKKIFMAIVLFTQITLHATNPNPYILQEDLPIYNLGDYAKGGVIFYLTPDGRHGLVASIVDMNDSDDYTLPWYPTTDTFDTIGAKANFIGFGQNYTTAGKINTHLIVNEYGAGSSYAAGACVNYSHQMNGKTYDDWYLPCLAELGLMREMKETITAVSISNGGSGFESSPPYWSSYEAFSSNAWIQSFGDATQGYGLKGVNFRVRAVRAF